MAGNNDDWFSFSRRRFTEKPTEPKGKVLPSLMDIRPEEIGGQKPTGGPKRSNYDPLPDELFAKRRCLENVGSLDSSSRYNDKISSRYSPVKQDGFRGGVNTSNQQNDYNCADSYRTSSNLGSKINESNNPKIDNLYKGEKGYHESYMSESLLDESRKLSYSHGKTMDPKVYAALARGDYILAKSYDAEKFPKGDHFRLQDDSTVLKSHNSGASYSGVRKDSSLERGFEQADYSKDKSFENIPSLMDVSNKINRKDLPQDVSLRLNQIYDQGNKNYLSPGQLNVSEIGTSQKLDGPPNFKPGFTDRYNSKNCLDPQVSYGKSNYSDSILKRREDIFSNKSIPIPPIPPFIGKDIDNSSFLLPKPSNINKRPEGILNVTRNLPGLGVNKDRDDFVRRNNFFEDEEYKGVSNNSLNTFKNLVPPDKEISKVAPRGTYDVSKVRIETESYRITERSNFHAGNRFLGSESDRKEELGRPTGFSGGLGFIGREDFNKLDKISGYESFRSGASRDDFGRDKEFNVPDNYRNVGRNINDDLKRRFGTSSFRSDDFNDSCDKLRNLDTVDNFEMDVKSKTFGVSSLHDQPVGMSRSSFDPSVSYPKMKDRGSIREDYNKPRSLISVTPLEVRKPDIHLERENLGRDNYNKSQSKISAPLDVPSARANRIDFHSERGSERNSGRDDYSKSKTNVSGLLDVPGSRLRGPDVRLDHETERNLGRDDHYKPRNITALMDVPVSKLGGPEYGNERNLGRDDYSKSRSNDAGRLEVPASRLDRPDMYFDRETERNLGRDDNSKSRSNVSGPLEVPGSKLVRSDLHFDREKERNLGRDNYNKSRNIIALMDVPVSKLGGPEMYPEYRTERNLRRDDYSKSRSNDADHLEVPASRLGRSDMYVDREKERNLGRDDNSKSRSNVSGPLEVPGSKLVRSDLHFDRERERNLGRDNYNKTSNITALMDIPISKLVKPEVYPERGNEKNFGRDDYNTFKGNISARDNAPGARVDRVDIYLDRGSDRNLGRDDYIQSRTNVSGPIDVRDLRLDRADNFPESRNEGNLGRDDYSKLRDNISAPVDVTQSRLTRPDDYPERDRYSGRNDYSKPGDNVAAHVDVLGTTFGRNDDFADRGSNKDLGRGDYNKSGGNIAARLDFPDTRIDRRDYYHEGERDKYFEREVYIERDAYRERDPYLKRDVYLERDDRIDRRDLNSELRGDRIIRGDYYDRERDYSGQRGIVDIDYDRLVGYDEYAVERDRVRDDYYRLRSQLDVDEETLLRYYYDHPERYYDDLHFGSSDRRLSDLYEEYRDFDREIHDRRNDYYREIYRSRSPLERDRSLYHHDIDKRAGFSTSTPFGKFRKDDDGGRRSFQGSQEGRQQYQRNVDVNKGRNFNPAQNVLRSNDNKNIGKKDIKESPKSDSSVKVEVKDQSKEKNTNKTQGDTRLDSKNNEKQIDVSKKNSSNSSDEHAVNKKSTVNNDNKKNNEEKLPNDSKDTTPKQDIKKEDDKKNNKEPLSKNSENISDKQEKDDQPLTLEKVQNMSGPCGSSMVVIFKKDENPLTTIERTQSMLKKKYHLENKYDDEAKKWVASVAIGQSLIATVSHAAKETARKSAAQATVQKLQQHYYSVLIKNDYYGGGKEVDVYGNIIHSVKRKGQGFFRFRHVDCPDIGKIKLIIDNYKNSKTVHDLVFTSEFGPEDRKVIQTYATNVHGLLVRKFGPLNWTFLVISKKSGIWSIVEGLINKDIEFLNNYQLLPPEGKKL